MLSSSEKYELNKKFRKLESQICKTDVELDSKADLVDGVVPTEQLPITQDIIDALNNANSPDGINYFTTLADLSSITPGTLINVASNYSALPAANTVPGEFYWVENSQGTSWLPGPLGGTYYSNGLYYSNGTNWIYTDMPYNATQLEVDGGLNNNKFVTPLTLNNASKWATKFDNWTVTTANTGVLTGTNVLWLVDTTAARTRTLDSAGNIVHIKDITGNAFTNNITINAPIGQTINGSLSETIDTDFGWVEYKLNGTDWTTTAGDTGGSINQLVVDSTPTNGSTNPVSSDGVFDSLALKQNTLTLTTTGTTGAATFVGATINIPQYQAALTNPVTGTGASGQVAYWSGTGTQTGSNNLYWDNVNGRLGIGTNAPSRRLHVIGSSVLFQNAGTFEFDLLNSTSGNYLRATAGATDSNIGTIQNIAFSFVMNGTRYGQFISTSGNFLLQNGGTFTDNGQRLQVYGSTLLRGSGTTSATTALLVQNSGATELFKVLDNGDANFGTGMYWDNANGRLGVGTNTPSARFHLVNTTVDNTFLIITPNNNSTQYPFFIGGATLTSEPYIRLNNNIIEFQRIGAPSTLRTVGSSNNLVIQSANDLVINSNGANERMRVFSGGNISIGTTSDLSARLGIRGSGTTSSTTALLVQNSTPSELFKVLDNGETTIRNLLNINASGDIININSGTFVIQQSAGIAFYRGTSPNSSGTSSHRFYNVSAFTHNSGDYGLILASNNFTPTSGTGIYSVLNIGGTINQTGGANGITRGLYVNPTLTAAADWRSLEWSNNSGWGLYGAGTANNYLGGGLGIGTTNLNTVKNINVFRNITGGTDLVSFANIGIVQSDVTSSYIGINNAIRTQATTFNITNFTLYRASTSSIGAGSTATNVYGYECQDFGFGTNQYGFYGSIAAATGRWNLYMNGTAANYLAGDTAIGTTTTSGGRLTVRGSGTASSTTALLIQNSTPSTLFEVLDSGIVRISALLRMRSISGTFDLRSGVSSGSINDFEFGNDQIGANRNHTSGTSTTLFTSMGYAPTSGTGGFIGFQYNGTINQTGGANGITRGLFVNPTLTSAADWRGIESVAASNANHTLLKLRNATVDVFTVKADSKIGFFNVAPVAQATTGIAASTLVGGGGTTITDTDTFDGYTIQQVVKALRDIGILA